MKTQDKVRDIAHRLHEALADLYVALHEEGLAQQPDEITLTKKERARAIQKAQEILNLAHDILDIEADYRD